MKEGAIAKKMFTFCIAPSFVSYTSVSSTTTPERASAAKFEGL